MKILIDKSFAKDLKKIDDKKIKNNVADIIESIANAKTISSFKNCKKLIGSKNAYRIRLGSYRIGFLYNGETVIFICFLHRSEIYKYFPK